MCIRDSAAPCSCLGQGSVSAARAASCSGCVRIYIAGVAPARRCDKAGTVLKPYSYSPGAARVTARAGTCGVRRNKDAKHA
eukprot:5904414-Lingulodinium_polyedra.AAC.1